MKIKIPHKIILLNEEFKVVWGDYPKDNGEIDFDNHIIRLDNSLKKDSNELLQTFFHEMGHAFDGFFGITADNSEFFAYGFSHFVKDMLNQIEDKKNGK